MNYFFLRLIFNLTFLNLFFFTPAIFADQCLVYLSNSEGNDVVGSNEVLSPKLLTPYAIAHQQIHFPKEGQFFTFEHLLRIAIHEAFEGLDFYTGEPLAFDRMSIDHVLPKALKGPDNIFNFVPTNGATNSLKGHKFTFTDLENLKIVSEIYGPRMMALLKQYGAFENREIELQRAVLASARRNTYRHRRPIPPIPNLSEVIATKPMVFRRTMDVPSETLKKLILIFASELSTLKESEFQKLIQSKVFRFNLNIKNAPELKFEDQARHNLILSYRNIGGKLHTDSLALETNMFEVSDYDFDRRKGKVSVEIKFHPMLILSLLEVPTNIDLAKEYIDQFFKPSDISRDEFIHWAE